jgi:hypothetical protein
MTPIWWSVTLPASLLSLTTFHLPTPQSPGLAAAAAAAEEWPVLTRRAKAHNLPAGTPTDAVLDARVLQM